MTTNKFTRTPLFGGAITAPLPNGYIDASDIRQIPDNQEVFMSPTSNASLIISLLERVNEPDLQQALRLHFDEAIVGAEKRLGPNGDEPVLAPVELVEGPRGAVYGDENKVPDAAVLVAAMETNQGKREMQIFRREAEIIFTGVVMGIVRLASVETDVLVEFHTPNPLAQLEQSEAVLMHEKFGTVVNQSQEAVRAIIDGLQIDDWNLFGT